MKSFFKKYKGLILVLLVVCCFVALSFIGEGRETKANVESVFYSDVEKWAEDVVSNKNVVTVIALSYCSHCKEYKPVLEQIAVENNLTVYWFEADLIEEKDYQTITSTVDFNEYTGASPYTAISNSGNVLAQTVGYANEEAAYSFFIENGLINE